MQILRVRVIDHNLAELVNRVKTHRLCLVCHCSLIYLQCHIRYLLTGLACRCETEVVPILVALVLEDLAIVVQEATSGVTVTTQIINSVP